jgi:hypothetical protein
MLNNFIPTIWSARILSALKKSLVYGQSNVVNRDYEGDIRDQGDSVKINSIGDVTIKDHARNTDIDGAEELNDGSQLLLIDQGKYFNFGVDDVDKVQANANVMSEAMDRSGYGLKDKADQFIASHYTDVPAANLLGSDGAPVTPTATTAYEKLVDLGVLLDVANVPADGRFVIVPSWYHAMLLKDDRFVRAGTAKTDQVLANGMVGEAAGFTIMKSNNVPNTTNTLYKIIAGHKMAFSYAEQIVKVEAYRPEKRFSDAIKGLHVYGGKLVRPYCWAVLTANPS